MTPKTARAPVARSQAPGSAEAGRQLSAREVKVHFDGVKAVDGVDLTISRGEILGLIGPNGAGKTTLLNALTGFQPLTHGSVWIDAEDVTERPPERFAREGVVRTFQGGRVFGSLSVFENLEVAALASGCGRREARDRALELIGLLGMEEIERTDASALSYGQERRVELARALATRPVFLLLDEPAAGLDETEGRELVETVRWVRDRTGCGVVLIDHDMHVVMRLCERIHVLDQGETIATGTPEEVRRDPRVIRAYLGSGRENDRA